MKARRGLEVAGGLDYRAASYRLCSMSGDRLAGTALARCLRGEQEESLAEADSQD